MVDSVAVCACICHVVGGVVVFVDVLVVGAVASVVVAIVVIAPCVDVNITVRVWPFLLADVVGMDVVVVVVVEVVGHVVALVAHVAFGRACGVGGGWLCFWYWGGCGWCC